jgi:hypothetical protein
MISTHNHVDMAASLVGGQFAVTLLPATRASNSVTAGRPHGPGFDGRAARGLAGTPAPCDLPADLGWPGGVLDRPPTTRRPGGAEPLGPRPASPAPTTQTRTDPPRPQRARPAGMASREEFALLGWGNNPSMVMLRGNGRRRAVGAGPMVRAFGETRTCAEDCCTAQLSRYNPARRCAIHQGWDREKVTQPRRRRLELLGDR